MAEPDPPDWPEDLIFVEITRDGLCLYSSIDVSQNKREDGVHLTQPELRLMRQDLGLLVVEAFKEGDEYAEFRVMDFADLDPLQEAEHNYLHVMNLPVEEEGNQGNYGGDAEIRAYANSQDRHVVIRTFLTTPTNSMPKATIVKIQARNAAEADKYDPIYLHWDGRDHFDAYYRPDIPAYKFQRLPRRSSGIKKVVKKTVVKKKPMEQTSTKRSVEDTINFVISEGLKPEKTGSNLFDGNKIKESLHGPPASIEINCNQDGKENVMAEYKKDSDWPEDLIFVEIARDGLCLYSSLDVSRNKRENGVRLTQPDLRLLRKELGFHVVEAFKGGDKHAEFRVMDFADLNPFQGAEHNYLKIMNLPIEEGGNQGNYGGDAEIRAYANNMNRHVVIGTFLTPPTNIIQEPSIIKIRARNAAEADKYDPIYLLWDGSDHYDACYRPEVPAYQFERFATVNNKPNERVSTKSLFENKTSSLSSMKGGRLQEICTQEDDVSKKIRPGFDSQTKRMDKKRDNEASVSSNARVDSEKKPRKRIKRIIAISVDANEFIDDNAISGFIPTEVANEKKKIPQRKAKRLIKKKGASSTSIQKGLIDNFCNICQRGFNTPRGLRRHYADHYNERKFICGTCAKAFKRKDHLTSHERTHSKERKFKCDTCGKGFKVKNDLNKHMKTHSVRRDHVCEICLNGFKTLGDLKKHSRVHSEKRGYHCDECGASFKKKSHLTSHAALHSEERKFKCPTCGKGFKVKSEMIRHIKTHSDRRDHLCETCQKGFNTPRGLKKHIGVHSDDRKFICGTCKKAFKRKEHLTSHEASHSDERKFKCPTCGKGFKVKSEMIRHMKIHL